MGKRLLLIVIFVIALAMPRTARADGWDAFGITLFLIGPPLTASTGLMIYDAVKAAQDEPPSIAAGWVQTLGAGPQALALTAFGTWGAAADENDAGTLGMIFMPFSMMTTALMSHGIWRLARDDPDAAQMFFTSTAIGINAPMTIWAVGAGLAGGVSKTPYAITQLVASSPVIGGSIYHLATGGDHRIDAVTMLTWSSALFAHGAISLMLPEHAPDYREPDDVAVLPTALPALDGSAPGVMIFGTL